ncbi:O-methyltransferase [Agromyces atrinae]|uniref:O-methyltransferase n=1 Tax=Agromyces atrinae TaxID=592376 RepID=A0A4Q2M5A1_9MICO|nr:O-methyltransferase [Agromyces atrinae]MCI2959209.1 O-methyltransferase [Agromyces atrinae]NYD65574.1 putative O-methyltransferase YrrM [Agromyces atrinae]RXZ85031.1 O-methyltransferase [Agromyces atrinae]
MSEHDLNWKFVDESVVESEPIIRARTQSIELGIEPVSPATGAQLGVLARASRASSIIEVGTGVGVSGLWLLSGSRDAQLTSIDTESEYQQQARSNFHDAGIASARVRLIAGRAGDVLPRMNESSYDIVFIDADPQSAIEYVEHGLRLAKPDGIVLVAHALWRGRVADPARREPVAADFRSLFSELAASHAVVTAISPVGDGLLQIVKRGI